MAETLLIVFIVFILLGMPISIAMGVGALGAAMFFPALNPDHHPDPLRRPAVGFLSAAVGAAVHPGRQHRGARRRGPRDHRPRHRAGRPLPRRARLRQRRRQHVLRRHLGLGGGRRLRARHVPHPADGAQGLRPRFRHRAHHLHRGGGADHPALDHRRDLRVDGRRVGGGDVRRRRSCRACWWAAAWRCRCSSSPGSATIPRSRRRPCRSSWPCCAMPCRR